MGQVAHYQVNDSNVMLTFPLQSIYDILVYLKKCSIYAM